MMLLAKQHIDEFFHRSLIEATCYSNNVLSTIHVSKTRFRGE